MGIGHMNYVIDDQRKRSGKDPRCLDEKWETAKMVQSDERVVPVEPDGDEKDHFREIRIQGQKAG